MGYALLLAYLVLTFLRPAELFPELERFQVMDVASVALLVGTALTVLSGRGPRSHPPQMALTFLFVLWATFSVVASRRWLGGALETFIALFTASGLVFFVVVLNAASPRRLRGVASVLVAMALYLALQSVLAYHFGVGGEKYLMYEGLNREAFAESSDDQRTEMIAAGVETGVITVRVRNLGFLSDPNDLAQALVAILPFLMAFLRPQESPTNTVRVWLPAALIVYAIALTRSRGGLLSLAAVTFLMLRHRLNRWLALAVSGAAFGALVVLGFVGGRSYEMDESSQGRTEAWYAGIQMLRSSPIWGVGAGSFTDHHDLVAHNSFVHCFAELGLVGYFIWLALILVTLGDLRRAARGPTLDAEGAAPQDFDSTEVMRWGRATLHSLAGYLVGAVFLSRTYSTMLFLLLGMGTAVAGQAQQRSWLDDSPTTAGWCVRVAAVEAVSIVLVWIAIRGLG